MKQKPFFRSPSFTAYIFALFCLITTWSFFWLTQPTKVTELRDENRSGSIELFANQTHANLTDLFSKAISDAKESVLLIVYTLTDPIIINSLKSKSLEGVKVRVICDARETPPLNSRLGSKVEVLRRFSPGRMHQKILVVDKRDVLIGSANMTTESLRMHGNLVTTIEDPTLARHILGKAETIGIEGFSEIFEPEQFHIGNQKVEMSFLPDDRLGVERILNLIRSAKKTIRIAMFTWTRRDMAEEVIEASKRGVKAEVIVDSYQGKGCSAKIVKMLKDNGIKIALSRGGPLLHHKFLYIDGTTLVNGSANWTKDAFTKNDDCFIVIHPLNSDQKRQMEALWEVIDSESIPVQNVINM